MIDCLAREVDRFIFTIPDSAPERRRWDLGRPGRELGGLAVAHAFEPDFGRALPRAQDDAATVLVTGSFHTVGDALARLPGFAPLGSRTDSSAPHCPASRPSDKLLRC